MNWAVQGPPAWLVGEPWCEEGSLCSDTQPGDTGNGREKIDIRCQEGILVCRKDQT